MPRRKPLSPALVLGLVALASRAVALGNPILHVDEQFYLAVAHAWARGAIPYVDIWDRKPIGLFLLYLPAGALPLSWGVWAYQLMALASAWGTALLIARLAMRARGGGAPDAGAVRAGLAYLVWTVLAEGQGGQSPIFYNLLTALAALLILRGGDAPPRLRDQTAAMLLIGAAIQINPVIVFEGGFFGLWALWRQWRGGRSPVTIVAVAVLLILDALLPSLAAAAGYAAIGHFDAWWFANVQSIFNRNIDPPAERFGNLAGLIAILSPLVAAAVIGLRFPPQKLQPPFVLSAVEGRAVRTEPGTRHSTALGTNGIELDGGNLGISGIDRSHTRAFLIGWLAVSLAALLLFGTWFDHYALRSMLPACVCAAPALGRHRDVARWAPGILVAAAIGGQVLLLSKLATRGTPAQFAALTRAVGSGPGCLFVYSSEPMLYPASSRCAATRYQFPGHLTRRRETRAIGVDQAGELARILAARPAVIVVAPPFRGERPELRRAVLARMRGLYRLGERVRLGRNPVAVYRLGQAASARRPSITR